MTSRTISLVVTILYSGDKAQYIAADNQNDGVRILWEDLPHVKLPYPKRENTTFVSYETMGLFGYEFFWPSVKEFGPLHNTLIAHITPKGAESIAHHEQILEDLSITSLSFQALSASGGKQRSLKRKASLIEPPKFRNRQWNPNSSNIDEAQMLLDDVASSMSLRLSKRPKLEPVEPSLVESPDREDSIASSRTSSGRPPPGLPTKPTSLGIVNNSDAATPMSISSDQPSLVPPPTTPLLPPPDAQNGNHEPVSLPPDFIIQTKPTSFGYHKSPTPPGLTMHARQHPPELPQSRSASQSHSSQTPRNLTPDHDSPAPRRPKPEDVPKIRKLSRELCDLRRHVTAAVTRETAILNELNALNSPPITESSVHIKSSDDESLLKTRLQAVEKTLKEERRRRMDAEATLKDIQRECREPFVVPALLDAFITVSKITSQAMDTNVKT